MTDLPPRRRILYIRHRRTRDIADGFRSNQDEWVETLVALADVTVMSDDFDMGEACDRVQPDFIVYESPFFYPAPLKIDNIRAYPEIPRIGLLTQDPYCAVRVNFLRTLDAMGARWIFTHMAETALRQSPELKDRIFSVAHLFDERVFRDYELPKDIPVSVFGGFLIPEMYDWRAATARTIIERFPTLIYTHPGYEKPIPRHKFQVTGEAYARLLNRSHFSLADTTIFDCLVRKHLEIPACGAVLVAPDAPVLRPYGFRDMENCILGEGDALFDKIAAVADDPALYERIRRNGHDLVHARYSRKQWRGILDFYECLRMLNPGETVRQRGFLGPFESVPEATAGADAIIAGCPDSAVSSFVGKWLACILDDDLDGMRDLIDHPPEWLGHILEPLVPFGIMMLLTGDAAQAKVRFFEPQRLRLAQSGFPDYDPEEVAWLSLTAALTGDGALRDAVRQASAPMRHLSLRRMQWLARVLAAGGDTANPPPDVVRRAPDDQVSLHWTGQLEIGQWLKLMARVLDANGQGGILKIAA
ncbi:MAG: glycosyltransferase family 1 protein [Alphaproteobacteria bacterium]|nr:glycosyltransferase family 1 protein [Alphaproteobacteria bacterium]